MRILTCILAFNLLTLSCMKNITSYKYADGSANVYILTPTSLEYDPVTPAESSTGTYSGGEPKTMTITSEQYKSIQVLLEKAVQNTAIHSNDRMKTSGAISVIEGSKERKYIIEPGCAEQKAIETLLKEVISN